MRSRKTFGSLWVPICASTLLATSAAAQQQSGPIEEIVVTGSFIKRSTFDSSSPIDFIGQEDFTKAGAITIRDVVQNLPYNIGAENFPDTARSGATTGMESINLRGLGLNSTLVLVNGRRQAEAPNLNNDGVAFVDTASIIPTIAIERVEVLKDGAAALYGSDAISGVVNFITRDRFEGFELSYDYQTLTEYDVDRPRDTVLQGIAGFGNERGHAVMAVSWLQRNRMPFHERDFTTGTGISATGSPGTFRATQAPGESREAFATRQAAFQATTFDPASVQGADLDCTNVPHASGRTPTSFLRPSPLLPTGAETCFFDFFPTQSMIDEERRLQMWAHFDYVLSVEHDVNLYGDFQIATNSIDRGNSTSYGFVVQPTVPVANPGLRNDAFRRGLGGEELINDAAAQALGFASAIAAAEANPLVGPMLFQGRPFTDIPEVYTKGRSNFDNTGAMNRDKTHIVLGVNGALPFLGDSWTFDLANTWSEHKFDGYSAYDTNENNMQLALQGFGGRECNPAIGQPGVGPCLFFNPYGSQYLSDPSSLGPNGLYNATALWDDMFDPLIGNSAQELWVVEGVITGNAFDLPAGPLGVALGAQYREQKFRSEPSGTAQNFDFSFTVGGEAFRVERDVYAVFGEIRVPLSEAGSTLGMMELSAAVRYEDYGGGTGDTTDPKIAMLWMPNDSLSLRGSFQTSFKAPGLAQLGGSSTSLNNVRSNPFDPTSPNQFVPGIAAGNPNLQPETADVWNLGFSWEPQDFLDGLRVNADYWSFEFEDAIRKEANTSVVDAYVAEVNAGIVDGPASRKLTLNSDGTVAVIRSEFINAASVDSQGVDLSVRYLVESDRLGRFDLFWNSTHITNYEFQESPTSPKRDGLGRRNFQTIGAPAPKMRANVGTDWMLGNHSATVTLRYTHSYSLDGAPNAFIALLNNRTPSTEVEEHLTVDVQYSFQMTELLGLPGPTLSFGMINLFDENPPRIDDGPGYDTKIHDPRGRIAYGRISMQF
ncbi:MAG: TonB-dependent receptor plug domain-containing protein [Pseudomonadales bacterium]